MKKFLLSIIFCVFCSTVGNTQCPYVDTNAAAEWPDPLFTTSDKGNGDSAWDEEGDVPNPYPGILFGDGAYVQEQSCEAGVPEDKRGTLSADFLFDEDNGVDQTINQMQTDCKDVYLMLEVLVYWELLTDGKYCQTCQYGCGQYLRTTLSIDFGDKVAVYFEGDGGEIYNVDINLVGDELFPDVQGDIKKEPSSAGCGSNCCATKNVGADSDQRIWSLNLDDIASALTTKYPGLSTTETLNLILVRWESDLNADFYTTHSGCGKRDVARKEKIEMIVFLIGAEWLEE